MTTPTSTAPAPATPASTADAGMLRVGGLSPLFAPVEIADPGRLRLGGLSPILGQG
ncbi:hypothetical protein [Roseomonas sp. HF4]|uniref:hypothetical protein n=1 Tax=Roseomonas sp. HF4 TaxID=2562313 RepID=UPI0014852610|nr:hypothetical protein [Roseomonas sp. HF4]